MPDDNEGNVGYLTWQQFNSFRWARARAHEIMPWLRVAGYLRSADADVRVSTSRDGHIGLPPTWLAADTIQSLLRELGAATDEGAANEQGHAELAVVLTREVSTADARWPYEDTPHYVQHMRCPECNHLALRYEPPRAAGERVIVACMLCRQAMDEDGFSVAALLLEKEEDERSRLGDDRSGGGQGEAVA